MSTKARIRPNLPHFPSRDAWSTAWQKHWSKVGLPGYELPVGGRGADDREFLAIARTPQKERARLKRISAEFQRAFKTFSDVGPAVTVFGSARFKPNHPYYKLARGVGAELAKAGFATLTGGGPGIMEAANRGARETGGKSYGLNIILEPFHHADMVFLESTYGDHDHRPFTETVEEFVRIVKDTVEKRGKVLVPTFAVGRAQLLTSLLAWMFRKKKVRPFPIFLDSPMAIEATNIYVRHRDLFDDAMTKFMAERLLRADLKTLTLSVTADDSRKINEQTGPCLIMAGAGMCNAGRILHHLKQNLWKPDTHVLIVGYQSRESLGRRLVEGQKVVSIHGEKVAVKAKVHTMGGFSAHAGQTDLLNWFGCIAPSKPRVILTHGEDGPREALAAKIQQRFKVSSKLPKMGDVIEL